MIVRVLGQHLHVFQVVAADVGIEEYEVVVDVLLAQNVFEILPRGHERLRQAGLQFPRVQGKVEHRNARIAEAVRQFRPQQSAVGGEWGRPSVKRSLKERVRPCTRQRAMSR